MAERFKNKLAVIGAQLEEIDSVSSELAVCFQVSAASGVQLDLLGAIEGVQREGKTDEEYRALILRAMVYNLSSGETNSILMCLSDMIVDFPCEINGVETTSSVEVATVNGAVAIYDRDYATFEIHLRSLDHDEILSRSVILPHDRYSRVKQTVAAGIRFYVRHRFEIGHESEEFRWQPEDDFWVINTIIGGVNHYTLGNPEILSQGTHGFCEFDGTNVIPNSRYIEMYQ